MYGLLYERVDIQFLIDLRSTALAVERSTSQTSWNSHPGQIMISDLCHWRRIDIESSRCITVFTWSRLSEQLAGQTFPFNKLKSPAGAVESGFVSRLKTCRLCCALQLFVSIRALHQKSHLKTNDS
jgi:hypothetical protein